MELPWSLTHLRPAPPLHPSFCRNEKLKPYRSNERSYDEDAQILKVIEAYCSTSSQSRHTLNSEDLHLEDDTYPGIEPLPSRSVATLSPLRGRRTQSWCCANIPLRTLMSKAAHID
ncbi:hypothetical protein M8J76_014979 [Diaphorina citri]|nr:hypothetical protein M8J76_014979 [Diaphorina citri]